MRSILLTGNGYTEKQVAQLRRIEYKVIHHPVIDVSTLSSLLPSIESYVLGGEERLDASLLARANQLRLISFVGTGYGTFVDEVCARERGIRITNTPGIMAPAVSEHTIGLILGMMRGLFAQNNATKRGGQWKPTQELSESAIGIVGMGATGTLVATILRDSFHCKVRYANRTRKLGLEEKLGVTFTDIDTIFRESDAVVLLVALAHETVKLVDARRLSIAKPGLVLINTAAAPLVDPIALRDAIARGQVSAAAFDGYWIEPLPTPAEDPFGLLAFPDDRFVVTPHSAAKTGTWQRMVDWAIQNVVQFSETNRR